MMVQVPKGVTFGRKPQLEVVIGPPPTEAQIATTLTPFFGAGRATQIAFGLTPGRISTPLSELGQPPPPPQPTVERLPTTPLFPEPLPITAPPPKIPRQVAIPPSQLGVIQGTAPGERFPGGFEPFLPTETPFERQERKKAREIELAGVFQRRFERPVRERLGTLPGDVGAPPQARILTGAVLAVGRPLSILFGPPEIREKASKFIFDFPEEIIPIATTAGFIGVTGAPGLALIAGAPVVKKVREGKIEEAIGLGIGTAAIIGTAALGAKAISKITAGRILKGQVKLKVKKKVTLTEKKLLAQLIKKAREPPKPPRITNVIRKDGQITIIVKAGGKVVDRRRLIEGVTPKSLIDAQLGAAKLQGAKFSGIRPPTALPRITPPISPLAVSRFDTQLSRLGVSARFGVALTQKEQQKREEKQLRATGISQISVSAQQTKQAFRSAQKQAQQQIQKQSQAQKQAQSQVQSQAQAQAQAQKQAQSQMEQSVLGEAVARGRARPRPPRPSPRRVPLPPFLFPELPSKLRGRVGISPRKAGYDAIVKVKGKPRKLAINVPRGTALSKGALFVDRTPSASFDIMKTGKAARRVAADNAWEAGLSRKFRPRKTKTALRLVEKTQFRIDSPGEVRGIPLAKRMERMV